MTKLTTEVLKEIIGSYPEDSDEIECVMARQILAYEQAAKNPVAWIVHMRTGDQFTTDGDFVGLAESTHGIHSTPLYAAPVLPKQPELVMKHSSVIAEQLDGVISSMDVTDHQRAVISCAIDRLNKNAEILQKKTTALIAPETLDYQSAKDIFNYLMNEEETNATVNGWNACRAEMLKAQPVSEPYKLADGWKLVPIEPTAAMFHAFNDDDYGRKSIRERYIQMIEAAPAQESE